MSRADVLVDADWVHDHLDDRAVVLVEAEVDEDVSADDTGHLAGAVRLDWATELQQAGVRDVLDRDAFAALLSTKGVSNDDTVVSTAATTTGSPPTPTGTSCCTATVTSGCSTAAVRSGSSRVAS